MAESERAALVHFRPLTVPDLPMVCGWLRAEHVRRWWRAPHDIEAVRAKYLPRILGDEPTEVFIASTAGAPVGLIQRYRFADDGTWEATVAGSELVLPAAAGIDYLIGVAAATGRGLGTAMILSFTGRLFDDDNDVQTIVVTPQLANRASCRVLEKAGYRLAWVGRLDSDDPSDDGDSALYVRHRSPSPAP